MVREDKVFTQMKKKTHQGSLINIYLLFKTVSINFETFVFSPTAV